MELFPRFAVLAIAAAALFYPASARADVQSWNGIEVRLPLSTGEGPFPESLRFVTDARYGAEGLDQLSFRLGPLWELSPHLMVGMHVSTFAAQETGGIFEQEHRLDLEPTLRLQWGAFTWSDRNRLEYRYHQSGNASKESWRYRNQLRLSYAPAGAQWLPYASDEVLVDLSGAGLNQNRANLGVGRVLSDSMRLDIGYGYRSRLSSGGAWSHDHLGLVSLFIAPKRAAVLLPSLDPGD
ncbi:DUF2490 domain-containing protein [bacterium]|nr:DUF2490 domain-containing protein [bacterium]